MVRLLGKGGMGQVHLASAEGAGGFEKLVALKVLGRRVKLDDARAHSLAREALIGVQLDHQNVVSVLDFGEDAGTYFVAMEYVRGFSTGDVLAHLASTGAHMPIRSAVYMARAIAEALDYVHSRVDVDGGALSLIHGDVSPGNIMAAADGRVKLADFGVAAFAEELLGADLVAGKPSYLPREAFKGATPQQDWDLYALGAVLYELISGKQAFVGRSAQAVRMAIDAGAEPLAAARPDCPATLIDVVDRALSVDPSARFETAAQLRDALDRAHPRSVDDMDVHREYLAVLYADEGFVFAHGALPTTAGFHATDMVPHITQAEDRTHKVRGLPTMRIGLSPALGTDPAKQRGLALAAALGARLGRDVVTIVYGDYEGLVDSLSRGDIDVAWMPPATFCAALERGAGAVVMTQRSGSTTYESALVVRADAGIASIEDLRGASCAWVDRESAAGYVYAIDAITRELGEPAEVLGAQHFHGSHQKVCEAVVNGWAVVGATYAVRDADGRMVNTGWADLSPDAPPELIPIAYAGPIPSDVIAHKAGMPTRLREDLVAAFGSLSDDAEGRELLDTVFNAEALVEGELEPYARLSEIFERVRQPG
jgi:phosphate/phosphite/phosphonate ABC transporter binding protein